MIENHCSTMSDGTEAVYWVWSWLVKALMPTAPFLPSWEEKTWGM